MAIAARVIAPYIIDVQDVAWFSIYEVGAASHRPPSTTRRARRSAAGVHRRRRVPYPQRQGRTGHERVDAGRLQPGLEARRGSEGPQRPRAAGHLLGRAPADRARADRLRPRVVGDAGRPTARSGAPRARRRRSRRAAGVLRAPGPLHRRRRHSLPAIDADRGRPTTPDSPPASTIGTRFHSAPVIRVARRDARCSSATWLAPTADGASTPSPIAAGDRLAGLCAWLEPRTWTPRCGASRPPDGDIDAVIDTRAILQDAHRDVVLQRAAAPPAPAQRDARTDRLREGVLRRPAAGTRHLRHARHRPGRAAASSSCAPTSSSPTYCRSTHATRSPHSLSPILLAPAVA